MSSRCVAVEYVEFCLQVGRLRESETFEREAMGEGTCFGFQIISPWYQAVNRQVGQNGQARHFFETPSGARQVLLISFCHFKGFYDVFWPFNRGESPLKSILGGLRQNPPTGGRFIGFHATFHWLHQTLKKHFVHAGSTISVRYLWFLSSKQRNHVCNQLVATSVFLDEFKTFYQMHRNHCLQHVNTNVYNYL